MESGSHGYLAQNIIYVQNCKNEINNSSNTLESFLQYCIIPKIITAVAKQQVNMQVML